MEGCETARPSVSTCPCDWRRLGLGQDGGYELPSP